VSTGSNTAAAATLIVCVGDLMTDVVAVTSAPTNTGSDTPSQVAVTGGGAAANTAAWLAETGHPVALVARAGDDTRGRAAVDQLHSAGVDVRVRLDPGRSTGACVVIVSFDGQRSMFPDPGANAALSPDDLPGDLIGPDRPPGAGRAHLHLSGYSLLNTGSRPAALAALERAAAAGLTISVDPASAGPLQRTGPTRVLEWVAGVDLLLANEDEACLLAGVQDPMVAGALLADSGAAGQVVVKLGSAGAAWFGEGAQWAVTTAVLAATIDTTGAGDCFAAGFLPAWLAAGRDPASAGAALAAGCQLAARVVTRAGARPHG
jgi:sugar/nucleoside kinase (ribokinase family)